MELVRSLGSVDHLATKVEKELHFNPEVPTENHRLENVVTIEGDHHLATIVYHRLHHGSVGIHFVGFS